MTWLEAIRTVARTREGARLAWLALLFLDLACARTPELAPDAPQILVFSRTREYRHDNIRSGIARMTERARAQGIRVVASEDPTSFEDGKLRAFRAVVFFNTTGDVLDDEQQVELERYIQSGGGFVGIHSAADTEWKGNDWPWYTRLVGAAFASHPMEPSNVQAARLTVSDPNHPATLNMPREFSREDEWYDFQRVSPRIRELLSVDEATYQGGQMGEHHPIAWFQEYDGGRSFYTGMGHTAASFEDERFLEHLMAGIEWAMGEAPPRDDRAVKPHPWRFERETMAMGIGEPIAMAFAPTGELYLIERRGAIHRFDVGRRERIEVAKLPVWSEGERGLVGLAFDPGFSTNQRIYLYFSGEQPTPHFRLSSFRLSGDAIEPGSEQLLLEIPIDRGPTAHTGGMLQFDAAGDLWLSTGDDTNPHESDGYSPHDVRPGREAWDATRSAANSQDLRGKILRVRPLEGGGYAIPPGNLFSEASEGRPEIYAMGLRNPYRFHVDSNGVLYWGEVGPDAKVADSARGPEGYDEFNRTSEPGNFGWPFWIGEQLAYGRHDWATGRTGVPFDPEGPENDFPRNTGARSLPAPRPAWIAYPYGDSDRFPEMSSGARGRGRTAMVGPIFDADVAGLGEEALPRYFDGKLFVYEFMRGWIRAVTMSSDGTIEKIEPFASDVELIAPIDLKIAPDGTLWVLEYGSVWFADNDDSRLSRIRYYGGADPLPVSVAEAAPRLGAAPLRVKLDGSGSFDRNTKDPLAFRWILRGPGGEARQVSVQEIEEITLTDPGDYSVRLEVEDESGGQGASTIALKVGNEPPRIEIRLGDTGNLYGDEDVLDYAIVVSDAEDGSTRDGSIDPNDVQVRMDYQPHGFDPGTARGYEAVLGSLDPGLVEMRSRDCFGCHQLERESAGPSLAAIAARYADDVYASQGLVRKVIEGGGGAWGDRSMAPHPNLDETVAGQMVAYILSLAPDASSPREGLPLAGTLRFDRHGDQARESQFFGRLNGGSYRFQVSYRDRGAEGVGPITARESRIFRYRRMLGADAEERHGTLLTAPMPNLIVAVEELPESELMTVMREDGSWLRMRHVDVGRRTTLRISTIAPPFWFAGGSVEVRLDEPDGRLLGQVRIESSFSLTPSVHEVDVAEMTGERDLYVVARRTSDRDKPMFIVTTLSFDADVTPSRPPGSPQ